MKPITRGGALLLLLATASFAGTNNDIVEFFLPLRGGWTQADLSRIVIDAPPAPAAAGDPFPYVTTLDNISIARVVYRGTTDNHIHELYLQPGRGWFQDDLSVLSGVSRNADFNAVGDPFPYVTNDGIPHVVYLGANGYIHQLSLSLKSGWFQDDPSGFNSPLEPAGGDPAAYVADGIPRIVYTGRYDCHIHELYLNGFWSQDDLSLLASQDYNCGDNRAPIGHLLPYVTTQDNISIARVVYRGHDDHIHELYLHDGWFLDDLSVLSGAPSVFAAGDPFPYETNEGIARVVYRSYDGHIQELYLQPGGGWLWDDLFQVVINSGHPAPAAASVYNPFAYVTPADGIPRVVYTGRDDGGHIHELYLQPRGGWFADDLSSILVDQPAITAGGSPRAYVTPDGIVARVVFRSVP